MLTKEDYMWTLDGCTSMPNRLRRKLYSQLQTWEPEDGEEMLLSLLEEWGYELSCIDNWYTYSGLSWWRDPDTGLRTWWYKTMWGETEWSELEEGGYTQPKTTYKYLPGPIPLENWEPGLLSESLYPLNYNEWCYNMSRYDPYKEST